ncbi:uncharacterized oxidoreductase dhs-27-like [Sitodiplosis mosellana]|uniref:uncharacterized oxidoreductase dhs-27-like n=1 Tax=Sitodiplosis mosellana TaxID=263140 RepID=UPI002443CF61|nr:uncharacterized oxidoreductase dhs-27-like [Sitodiplosis mosellana]
MSSTAENPTSEIVLPNYIQAHLNRISAENDFVDSSVDVRQGSQIGDGFASNIWSVTIAERNSDKKLHLVCKVALNAESNEDGKKSKLIFKREADFYTKLMPTFVKFQAKKGLSDVDQFLAYPKCYGTTIDDENGHYVIILEDLRPQGFKLWPKIKTSPIENARLAMREIGKFHGISIAMKVQKPEHFAEFKSFTDIYKILFNSKNVEAYFTRSYDYALKSFKRDDFKAIMSDIRKNFRKYFDECLDEKSASYFGVICHGDFWNNNILYTFNENGAAEDIRLLDWQVIRHGSPAIDIAANIFTSTDKSLRDDEYENLLQLYYNTLSKTVKLLGSNPDELFTFENLQSELKRCGIYALLLSPLSIQVSQADASQLAERGDKSGLVGGLTETGQLEYERRLNGVFEDVTRLGYINKIH